MSVNEYKPRAPGELSQLLESVLAFGDDTKDSLNQVISRALANCSEESELVSVILDSDAEDRVRFLAMKALAVRESSAAIAMFMQLLTSRTEGVFVRRHAAFLMTELPDSLWRHEMLRLLDSEDLLIRECAAHTLGSAKGDRRGVSKVLAKILIDKEQPVNVRVKAAASLGALRSRSAVSALLIGLEDSCVLVRAEAAFALGQIGESSTLSALRHHLDDNDVVPDYTSIAQLCEDAIQKISPGRRSDHGRDTE